jgi:hypothetical protein
LDYPAVFCGCEARPFLIVRLVALLIAFWRGQRLGTSPAIEGATITAAFDKRQMLGLCNPGDRHMSRSDANVVSAAIAIIM